MSTPQNAGPSVKYRASCDRCQDNKVKCGQEKPQCERCAKKGLACVYSPIRTMGRPRKSQPVVDSAISTAQRSLDPVIEGHDMPTSAIITPSSLPVRGSVEDRLSPLNTIEFDFDGLETTSSLFPLSSSRTMYAGGATRSSCYTSILSTTLKLEQDLLAAAPHAIGLERALQAEGNFRQLKHQVFICQGEHHSSSNNDSNGITVRTIPPTYNNNNNNNNSSNNSNNPETTSSTPCLSSHESRLVLTSLLILADRVVDLLKETLVDFQPLPGVNHCSTRCSKYFGTTTDDDGGVRIMRVMDYHPLRAGLEGECKEDGTGDDVREKERGYGYESPGSLTPGEARALRGIYKVRVQKFWEAVGDIRVFVLGGGVGLGGGGGSGNGNGGGSWVGIEAMADNLVRRVEVLQKVTESTLA